MSTRQGCGGVIFAANKGFNGARIVAHRPYMPAIV
jgi:hypothetical protein